VASTFSDKPECGISQQEVNGRVTLICRVHANPPNVTFLWRIKGDNDTIEEGVELRGMESYLTLESGVDSFSTYLCFAKNSVGMSIPCERDVQGKL